MQRVARVRQRRLSYLLNFGSAVISLDWVKLGTSNFVCGLILTSTIAFVIDYPQRECVHRSRGLLKCWEIPEAVQDGDIATTDYTSRK